MPSDDILDLLGRYATGSLTSDERQRLFDAALSDQELFEELAREQELKMLLEEPGARTRMIHALDTPKRRTAWILSGAVAAALAVVLVMFLMRPSAKPVQVAIATTPTLTSIAPAPVAQSEPQPAGAPRLAKAKATAAPAPPPQPAVVQNEVESKAAEARAVPVDQPSKDAVKKETVPVQPAPASPPRVQAARMQQQNAVGGPRQQQVSSLFDQKTSSFGFHYSLDTKGHLIIVPAADGYLFVTANDGTVLYDRKQIAAAITTDIALPDGASSITITFSENSSPVETKPTERSESTGRVEGRGGLAVIIKVK